MTGDAFKDGLDAAWAVARKITMQQRPYSAEREACRKIAKAIRALSKPVDNESASKSGTP